MTATKPPLSSPTSGPMAASEPLKLAQQLLEQLTISSQDWHRLKANRKARALEQAAAAIVFLLKDQPQEALPRLQQATGWLDRSVSAPPCPTHGHGPNHPAPTSAVNSNTGPTTD